MIRTSALSSITALAALAMPKCPLCVLGLLPALGIELRFLAPVTIAMIAAAVLTIAITRSSWWQPAAALAGAGCAIAGRFVVDVPLLFHAGVLVIVAASVLRGAAVFRRPRLSKPHISDARTATAAEQPQPPSSCRGPRARGCGSE